MRSRYLPIAFLLLGSSLLAAQANFKLSGRSAAEYAAEQRRVVGLYCRLDFDGSRFSDEGWQKLRPLMQERQNPDFRSVDIVSRYQVLPAESPFKSREVRVSYTVTGRFDALDGYIPATSVRTVVFDVDDKTGEMAINSVEPGTPRASKRAVVQWLKARLTTVQDPVEKLKIESALKTLDPSVAPAGVPGAEPGDSTTRPSN